MALDAVAGVSSHDTVTGRSIKSRHVAFAARCQVILPEEETDEAGDEEAEDYFTDKGRRGSLSRSGVKIRRRLSLLKSKATSHPHRDKTGSGSSSNASDSLDAPIGRGRSGSESHAHKAKAYMPPALSPSLPVNRAPIERKKLVSPPPPTRELSPSPIDASMSSFNLVTSMQDAAQSLSPALLSTPSDVSTPESPAVSAPKSILARPKAVRKPMALGAKEDAESTPSVPEKPVLRVPQVIESPSSLPSPLMESKELPAAHAILNWSEEDDTPSSAVEEDSNSSSSAIALSPPVHLEEDLNKDCVCRNCEDKMRDALMPDYAAPWTRSARRKYLADRQEALNKERKKSLPPPIWLRAADAESDTTAVRSIQADEVDAKKGKTKDALVSKTAEPTMHITGVLDDAERRQGDEKLQREVAEEVRIREEEAAGKKQRTEMRRLSCDVGTGLRVGGGGARAMMRQLEQAEQAERRARIERNRSPKIDSPEEAPRPMGAAGISAAKPVVGPERRGSPLAEHLDLIQEDRPSRTPSPFRRMLQAVRHDGSSPAANGDKSPASSQASSEQPAVADKATKSPAKGSADKSGQDKDLPSLHKTTSPLVKRELTLGIPVQTGPSARTQSQWHSSADSLVSSRSGPPTPPKPTRPLSTIETSSIARTDARKLESSSVTSSTDSATPSAKSASRLERAQSMNAPRHSSPLTHEAKLAPHDPSSPTKMRRAFSHSQSQRPRDIVADASRPEPARAQQGGGTRRSQSLGPGQSILHNPLDSGTVTQARHKARSSIRGLVARIRS